MTAISPSRLALAGRRSDLHVPGLAVAAPVSWASRRPLSKPWTLMGRTCSPGMSDFAGKIVVLEWTSSDCPYCGKHYGSGNMQALQKKAVTDGVVWLTVSVPSAPGREGYFTPQTARAWRRGKVRSHATAILLGWCG